MKDTAGGEKSQPAIDADKKLHKTESSHMNHREDGFFLPENASKARIREAENARRNRLEIVKAHSQGQVTRRDLMKWGLITTGGLLAPIHGLNLFVSSARRWARRSN